MMKINKKSSESLIMLGAVVIILIAGVGIASSGFQFGISSGFTTAYEGVKPSFQGVYYQQRAHEQDFRGTQMNWDADDDKKGLPDIEGEMTSIFLPIDVRASQIPDFIPQARAIALEDANTDPVNTYTWEIDNMAYKMEEYDLKWFVSLEAGYDSTGILQDAESDNQRYNDVEVWFKLDTSPSWIFEGADQSYFTVGKIEVDYVQKQGREIGKIDVSPESQGTAMTLFYQPYGSPVDFDEETWKGYESSGVRLNPEVFRDTLYTMIRLDDFGTQQDWGIGWIATEGDIVTWEFTVKVFVIGEWELIDVQDVSELELDEESGYGRESKFETVVGFDFERWWGENWTLETKLVTFFIAILLLAGVVIIAYGFATAYAGNLARTAGAGVV